MAAAKPTTTSTPLTLTGPQIASQYGKNNAQFYDPLNAGKSNTTGAFGELAGLERYAPTQYPYQSYTTPSAITSESGKRADLFANIMAQSAQYGQQENAQRGQAILSGYDQQIANNRALADRYEPQFQAAQTASLADLTAGYDSSLAERKGGQSLYDSAQSNALSDLNSGYGAAVTKRGGDITRFDAEQAKALADIQSGYSAAQGELRDRYDRNMGYANQYGASMRSDLADQRQRDLGAANQSAIRRGLGNTTIRDSLNRGVNADYTRNNLALEDRLLQNRLATDQALSGDYANSIIAGGQATAAQRERAAQGSAMLGGQYADTLVNRGQATAGQRERSSQGSAALRNQYADTFLNRGQAIAAQRGVSSQLATQLREANLGRENQAVTGRLGFLSAIQNPYPTLADISNLYLQSGVLDETKASRTAV